MHLSPVAITALTAAAGWFTNYGLSIFVNAMEAPDPQSSRFYRYVYRLGHGLISGNMNRIGLTRPDEPPKA